MRTLVLADIHANEPALRAVLEAAGSFDRLVFLGDLPNFGTSPNECISILKELDPICIMGNHDELIITTPKNFWDKWTRTKLSEEEMNWISTFSQELVLDDHILLLHGSYSVDYDILPNTPDEDMVAAFKDKLRSGIDEVWFGHYHYQIDREIGGVTYRCIRPVGHHRDKDTRASYSIFENGKLTHYRVPYDLEKVIKDFRESDCFEEGPGKEMYAELLANAFHSEILKKDLKQMQENEER